MSNLYSGSKLSASKGSNPSSCYVSDVLYQNRYCTQNGFSILICGGEDKNTKYTNQVLKMKVPSFEVSKFPYMVKPRCNLGSVVLNSDIMAIGGLVNVKQDIAKSTKSIEIYCDNLKNWKLQSIQMTERFNFGCCYFMKKLFVIGGWIKTGDISLRLCQTYSLKTKKWCHLRNLNIARDNAACTIFEGKIVVTGGYNDLMNIKSVESYDYYENKWTYVPHMIGKRMLHYHAAVSMGKL